VKRIRLSARFAARASLFCVLATIQLAGVLFAAPYTSTALGPVITAYDIHADVGLDGVADITEKITADFGNNSMHGLYRDIPLMIARDKTVDGRTSRVQVKARASDVSAYDDFHVETRGYGSTAVLRIYMGDPQVLIKGKHSYTVRYKYDMGPSANSGQDEFYFNLIGPQWEYPISGVTFTVRMPKAFDPQQVTLTSGRVGSTDGSGFASHVEGNTISGNYDGTLLPGEAATIKINLPGGYFAYVRHIHIDFALVPVGLAALFLAGVIGAWWFRRERGVVETVEFHPPQGLNSAEAGCYAAGDVCAADVLSLIIQWANKGYITITETENGISLSKIAEPKDLRPYEQMFFEKIFSFGSTVTPDDLKYKFGDMLSDTQDRLYDYCNPPDKPETDIYTQSQNVSELRKASAWLPAILVFMSAMYAIKPLSVRDDFWEFLSAVVASCGISVVYLYPQYMLVSALQMRNIETKEIEHFRVLLGALSFVAVNGVLILGKMFFGLPIALSPLQICTLAMISLALSFLSLAIPRRTAYSTRLLGQLLGFKRFLEVAEKDRLEALVAQTPTYFFDVLPYAYVLGVSDAWANKLEQFVVTPPQWYQGGGSWVGSTRFMETISNGLNNYAFSMTASPPSGGSGGVGGGGFSGGGGGGGGGGGW